MRMAVVQRLVSTIGAGWMLLLLGGVFLHSCAASAMEHDDDFALPAESRPADELSRLWQAEQHMPSAASLYEVNWDEATAVDLQAMLDDEPESLALFGDFFYRGAGYWAEDQWLIGNGDRLGLFSFVVLDGAQFGRLIRFTPGAAIHFISGPVQTDLPPRVYDLSVGFPQQGTIGDHWSYDVMFRLGLFTDFEGSAREGLRFPSHAVLYRRTSDCWQWALGIDYLDRDDIRLLPVFGALWTPSENLRVEAVFPKPLIGYRWPGGRWTYIASEMGGGTWDIQRASGAEDVFTYRDFRLLLGVHGWGLGRKGFLEVGYSFSRHLEYRSGTPKYKPPDTVILRSILRY